MSMKLQTKQNKREISNDENILEITNLTKDFGGLRAVDDVHLTVKRGELRGLIGPNGAGKSTIFHLIMGTHPSTTGQIKFKGSDISKMPTWTRARLGIGIKMQIPGVYGELTGFENMRIAAQNYVAASDIDEEIDRIAKLI